MSKRAEPITLATFGDIAAPVLQAVMQNLGPALAGRLALRIASKIDRARSAGTRIVLTSTDASVLERLEQARKNVSAQDRFIVCGRDPHPEFVTQFVSMLRLQSPDRVTFLDCDLDEAAQRIERLLRLRALPDPERRIFSVSWRDSVLYVVNANLHRLVLPLAKLQAKHDGSDLQWSQFEIEKLGGSFVHWPQLDLHLGWPELCRIENPDNLLPIPPEVRKDLQHYGRALRELREEQKLSREDVVSRIGQDVISTKTLSRFELGERFPSARYVERIASAFEMTSKELLDELARRSKSLRKRRLQTGAALAPPFDQLPDDHGATLPNQK